MRYKNYLIGTLLVVSAFLTMILTPTVNSLENQSTKTLAEIVPKQFGDWKEVPSNQIQMNLSVTREGDLTTDNPYDDVLMRTYMNSKGQQVMLALAYGKSQRQEVKIHRPELCYVAQGYQIKDINPIDINVDGKAINAKSMLASSHQRNEIVVYWIRIGSMISQSAWQTRGYIFKQGLKGKVVDGILVRTSQTVSIDQPENFSIDVQKLFLTELVESSPMKAKQLMLGRLNAS